MKKTILFVTVSFLFLQSQAQTPQQYQGTVGKTLSESKEWWPDPVKPLPGSPNIIWVLLDDVGFGASSTFGGLIPTPTFDSLAANGLRYTNFHTCAICAPTRAALMTGRNAHSVHMGGFAHTMLSAGFPGYDGRMPASSGTIAEILRDNGYNTFVVGKYGLTPDEEATDAGPFDHWPVGKGFDHFYGFLGSQTDQYKPDLIEDNAHITPDGRNLNESITDKAIGYIQKQQKASPGKPFFLYYSPGATHAPHQVPTEWMNIYKGKFDEGWDVYREKVLANQKKLGIISANAQLPDPSSGVKPWNSLSSDEKKLYARFMEIYAAYLTYIDYQFGRVVNYLKESKQLDNTLIFVIIGDNGASKEGTYNGVINGSTLGKALRPEQAIRNNLDSLDEIGTPAGRNTNYPLGWAQACNTPFKYWKQDANSEGGTRNPLIVFYPKAIKDKGGIRTQYGHVIDMLPTTLEFVGIQQPEYIKGIKQDPVQGTSLVYSFNDATAASRHTDQYYYIFGSRSIYKDGWKAETLHHPDFVDESITRDSSKLALGGKFDHDVWELYNLNEDFNERTDLAKKYPEKLKTLQDLYDAEAKQYNIYPFIDWDDVVKRRIHNANANNTALQNTNGNSSGSTNNLSNTNRK